MPDIDKVFELVTRRENNARMKEKERIIRIIEGMSSKLVTNSLIFNNDYIQGQIHAYEDILEAIR